MTPTALESRAALEPHPEPEFQPVEPDQWLREREGRRDAWVVCIFFLAAGALIAAIVAIGFAIRAIDQSAHSSAPAGASVAAETAPTSAMVHLSEFAIEPKAVTVAQGGTLQVMNMGAMQHNLAVKDTTLATPMIDANGSANLSLGGLSAGTYQIYCQVPGHEAAGMVATLKVVSPGGGSAPVAAAAMAPDAESQSSSKAGAKIDFNAKPGPDWHAFDPTLTPADGATVHNVTFHATEKVMEVAPGVRQELWTFNGQVPGPVLRGHVGDVFNVTLVNDAKMGHSLDFHASRVSPNVAMRTINPGESLVYQFKAEYAGTWLYHCGTAPTLMHLGNGMYGAVIIDPPNLPPVDHEYVMVQSELYLGPQGQSGDYAKMQAADFDAVVFNGYVSQYKFAPIMVQPGQRIRVWVVDGGPNEDSSFHVVGTIFDTVYKEGHYELRPDGSQGGSQSLDLQPAQGGFVEFTLDDPGQYTMVNHKFANVGKGAVGIFQAGDAGGSMSH